MAKVIEFILELIGWVQIVLFPLLIGFFLGAVVYYYQRDEVGLVLGIIVAFIGLIAGIILATRIWKKKGTVSFLSRIRATPELYENEN